MSKIKITKTQVISDPSLKSYIIKVMSAKGPTFTIPVVDVRDGQEQRDIVTDMAKNNNRRAGSKYMKPTITGFFGESYNDRGTNTIGFKKTA
jgi:hypothetical protein